MPARILIVDDEENLARFLQQALLLEFPGGEIAVDLVYSGEEGLSRLAAQSYDLIIADYRMPGFNGLELIQGVRYLDPYTAIILMTAYGSNDLVREAQALGVRQFFSKPFEIDDMLLVVRQMLPAQRHK